MRFFVGVLVMGLVVGAGAQVDVDTDRDGLSDRVEMRLLERFAPTFMVSREDCSVRPASFVVEAKRPTVTADDGTIYGQAFPRKGSAGEVELHYYHLWRRDCGELGHRLDAEHVAVLLKVGAEPEDARALYWYAAAHEDTVCDASHLTRAASLHAEDHGATIWISAGKHGSFLSEVMCTHGCGGDRCTEMEALKTTQIVNLGELNAPMNGIAWLGSAEWPLKDKLGRTDFSTVRVARLEKTEVAWASPSKRPAQAAILGMNAGIGGAATGMDAAGVGLDVAGSNASSALDVSATKTGRAVKKSSQSVWGAVKKSVRKTGELVGGKKKE